MRNTKSQSSGGTHLCDVFPYRFAARKKEFIVTNGRLIGSILEGNRSTANNNKDEPALLCKSKERGGHCDGHGNSPDSFYEHHKVRGDASIGMLVQLGECQRLDDFPWTNLFPVKFKGGEDEGSAR